LQVSATRSRLDQTLRLRAADRPSWTNSYSSHLRLLRATAIV
jgi:hypothetical protein